MPGRLPGVRGEGGRETGILTSSQNLVFGSPSGFGGNKRKTHWTVPHQPCSCSETRACRFWVTLLTLVLNEGRPEGLPLWKS